MFLFRQTATAVASHFSVDISDFAMYPGVYIGMVCFSAGWVKFVFCFCSDFTSVRSRFPTSTPTKTPTVTPSQTPTETPTWGVRLK